MKYSSITSSTPVKRLTGIINFEVSLANLLIGSSLLALLGILAFGVWQYVVVIRDGWILGDWLVNYEDGGFKRRGLSGTFFLLLNNLTNVNPAILVFSALVMLYGLFFLLLFILLRRRKLGWSLLMLICNPATLLFWLGDGRGLGRKEIVVIILLALFVMTHNLHSRRRTLIFAALISVATLLHELTFFFVPYFMVFECWSGTVNRSRMKHFLVILLASGITLSAIAGFGTNVNLSLIHI